jgi:hypothetical protein
MAVDMIARLMAMRNGGGSGDSYTKDETDQLLDGKADLVDGKVPASELPSYVDDTVEGYYYQGAFYEDSEHTITITGETGKIYIDMTTNKSYRWTGTVYVRIDECPAFGETQGTIYEGNKGKLNADAIAAIKDGASIDSFADVEAALAGKQPTLTTAQQAAADSGITSAKVQQFEGKVDAPVPTDITEESQLDGLSQGTITTSLGVEVAGYSASTWVVIRTYDLNVAKSRRMQIIESQYGGRKTRFYNGAWGSWT